MNIWDVHLCFLNMYGMNLCLKVLFNVLLQNLDSPNGIHSENMTGSSTSSACSETISEEAIVIEKKPNIEDGSIPQKGSSPTLDRINL